MFFHVSSEFHENLGAVALSCPGPRIQRETRVDPGKVWATKHSLRGLGVHWSHVVFWVETNFQWVNPLNNWSFVNSYVTNFQRVSINGWWWLEPWNFMTFHILGISSSQLTNSIIFQRGRSTTNQYYYHNHPLMDYFNYHQIPSWIWYLWNLSIYLEEITINQQF